MEIKGQIYELKKLTNLNRQLDLLYSLIHSQFDSITDSDYKTIGPMLDMLLSSLKDLRMTIKNISIDGSYLNQIKKLEGNYSALYELNSDIKNFKKESPELQGLKILLKETSDILNSKIS